MANAIKKLAGQTAIYGLPSIVGRILNYLLVPLHTEYFATGQFGVITEMYSYVAFLVILLAFGMETSFFRFSSQDQFKEKNIYSSITFTLFFTTSMIIGLAIAFPQPIADFLDYPNHSEYVVWFAMIVGLDALSTIPLARLRRQEKAGYFAFVNIANIIVNIGLNILLIGYVYPLGKGGETNWIVDMLYQPGIGVGYVFIANLVASMVKFLLLTPVLFKDNGKFDAGLLKQMFLYGFPMLLGNLAIIVNEVIDKPLLKWLLTPEYGSDYAKAQVGIYGACAKLSILMMMFIQAFRYAAEPFFFNRSKDLDSKQMNAKIMKYFVIICAFIFLGVTLYIDILKYFIQSDDFWVGLGVVPILLMAYIFYGIWYNLSVWYKLTNKTRYGAYIPLIGAAFTILLNFIWIPMFGFMGSAWATFIAYGVMMVISYFLGQKHYPINYPVKRILFYLFLAGALFAISNLIGFFESSVVNFIIHTLLMGTYIGIVYAIERPKKSVL